MLRTNVSLYHKKQQNVIHAFGTLLLCAVLAVLLACGAQASYLSVETAQANYDSAESDLNTLKSQKASGSYGFFVEMGSTAAAEALKSVEVVEDTGKAISSYTQLGVSGDATSLDSMKEAVQAIAIGNKIRNDEGVEDLKITDSMMAYAQADANYSSECGDHAGVFPVGENCAWTSTANRAYNLWYGEKEIYLAHQAEYDEDEDATVEKYGEVGHYLNLVNIGKWREYTVTGFAICQRGYTYTQTFLWYPTNGDTAYTVSEYATRLANYITSLDNRISVAETALDNAAEALQDAKYAEFVTRLYKACLDRSPDASGLDHWVNLLKNGTITGIQTVKSFVFSKEFLNKNYCDECYVKHLYQGFLGRDYDAAGLANWLKRLKNGATREEIFNRFSASTEFSNICSNFNIPLGSQIDIPQYGTVPQGDCAGCGKTAPVASFVTRLYSICLGRTPDKSGFNHWCTKLWNHERTGYSVGYGFVFSTEYLNKKTSNASYVTMLYNVFMDRSPDSGGYAHWLNKLETGTSRLAVFKSFANSAEYKTICASYGIAAV